MSSREIAQGDNDSEVEETTIILTDPVGEDDLTCSECPKPKSLSSIQAFTSHMKTQHGIKVIKSRKPRKGDAKKAEQQAKKDLKEKQRAIPRSVLDIKNLIPEGTEKNERARLLFQHIKESKQVPLSQQVILALEKRESEIFGSLPDGMDVIPEVAGNGNGDTTKSTPGSLIPKDKRNREKLIGEEKLALIRNDVVRMSMDEQLIAKKCKRDVRFQQYLDLDASSMVEFLRVKGFHEDVCDAFEKARITGYNLPELVSKDFLKSIGITVLGDLGGLSRLFQMILDTDSIDNEQIE
jgi:hypothetical protein